MARRTRSKGHRRWDEFHRSMRERQYRALIRELRRRRSADDYDDTSE